MSEPEIDLAPYELDMLAELRAMRFDGPVTSKKIQRRLRVGFAKAEKLRLALKTERTPR